MAADPFHIGIIEALFKVIEERVPYGKQITTVTSVLIVFGVIVFVSQFLMATLVAPLGGVVPYVAALVRYLSGYRLPMFHPLSVEPIQVLALLTILDGLIVLVIRLEKGQSENRDRELQKRLNALEKMIELNRQ